MPHKTTIAANLAVALAMFGKRVAVIDADVVMANLEIIMGLRSPPVALIDETGEVVRLAKARELAGGSDMLFIRNGRSGRIECRSNRRAIELNEQLHAHN